MATRDDVRSVYLFVLDTMADWEPGYAVAGINQAMFQTEPGRYAVRTVAADRRPIRTMGGLTIVPDGVLEEIDPEQTAMLILPGGSEWEEGKHLDAMEKARELMDSEVPVAAICGATWALAQGGLLDERPHTSNAREYVSTAPNYRGSDHYVDAPAVREGDLITASGTAPVDFAHRIFERLELYAPPVLEAWYALYARGDASAFYALAAGAPEAPPAS